MLLGMKIHALGVWLLWAICGGFVFGVLVRSIWVFNTAYAFGAIGIAVIFLFAAANDARTLRLAFVGVAAVIACGAGVLRMQSVIVPPDLALSSRVDTHVELEAIVSDEQDNRATQVRVPVRVLAVGSSTAACGVLVIFPAHTDVYYGEHIRVSGKLAIPQAFDAGGGRQFDYQGFLAAQGIQCELDRATLLDGSGFEGNQFVAFAYAIKEGFVAGLQQALPEPQSGLAGGITVGDKRALGKDITAEFRTVSLVHIVVLSGYNITVIISWLFDVLARAPRVVRFGTGGFVAVFFAVMTGFAPTSLRAALMALIAITGTLSGRIYKPARALALVGAGMVAWNPYLLVHDPGFQLSFLATVGLMAFSPIVQKSCTWIPEYAKLRETMVSTLSAQTAVLPLLLYQSDNLSLVSIPANLLVLSIVPTAMSMSAIAAVSGLIFAPIAPIVGYPAYLLLSYILGVAHWLAAIPYAAVTVPAFSAWVLVPIYAILFGYALKHQTNQTKTAAPSGTAV